MTVAQSIEHQLSTSEGVKEYFAQRRVNFEVRRREFRKNLAEGKVVVEERGQWTIKLGTEMTFDQVFGPPSEAEIEANKRKPISLALAVTGSDL